VDKVGFIAIPHYVGGEEGNHKELQRETSIEESVVITQLGKDLVKMSISKLSFIFHFKIKFIYFCNIHHH